LEEKLKTGRLAAEVSNYIAAVLIINSTYNCIRLFSAHYMCRKGFIKAVDFLGQKLALSYLTEVLNEITEVCTVFAVSKEVD
jgi:hypothetical protein